MQTPETPDSGHNMHTLKQTTHKKYGNPSTDLFRIYLQVKAVSEKTVLAQKAYMLFYVRDSSAIKISADVVRKGNMLANAPSSKVILQPASTLNGATTERKSSFSECGSAKSKVDDTFHSQTISMVGNSSGELLATEASSVVKNGNAIQKASCLQANSEELSNGLQLTTPSRDSTKLKNPSTDRPRVITSSHNQKETKDVAHPFQLKENGGITTSHVNAASDTCEREKVQEKSGLYNGCNGEVGSSIVAAQPINSGLLNLQKHSKNLLRRNNQYVLLDYLNLSFHFCEFIYVYVFPCSFYLSE